MKICVNPPQATNPIASDRELEGDMSKDLSNYIRN